MWKLDRIGRWLPQLLCIVTGLRNRGVAFRSLTEQWNDDGPIGSAAYPGQVVEVD